MGLFRTAALAAGLELVVGGAVPSAASCAGPLLSRVVQGSVTACEEPSTRATAALTRLLERQAENRRQVGLPVGDIDAEAVLAPTLARPHVLVTLQVEFSLDLNADGRKRWQFLRDGEALEVVLRGVEGGCASVLPGKEVRLLQSGVCCDLFPPTDTTCLLDLDAAEFVPEGVAIPRLNKKRVRERASRNSPAGTH